MRPEKSARLPQGKVPWDLVAAHLPDALGPGVLLGPGPGEDAALVHVGGEVWAVASDPISFTDTDAGWLSVQINANDVAVMGAEPRFFLLVILLAPGQATPEAVGGVIRRAGEACEQLGVALIGGHTEVSPGLSHTVVVGTMLGRVRHRPITSAGLRPGDWVGMTKWAGVEGTAVLLAEYGDRLRALDSTGAGADLFPAPSPEWLSVVPEALAAASVTGVTAMHDVTEGGVGEALHELGRASGLSIEVNADAVPVLPQTRRVCGELGIDPLGLLGSGALLVGCGEQEREELEAVLADRRIPFAWIGRARASREAGRGVPRFPRDEILKTRLMAGVQAVVFDMDGTLVASTYDWVAIRRELEIDEPSLIDALNHLPQPEREAKWERLEEIESHATRAAVLQPGVPDLMELLRERGIATALVTNNSAANAASLLDRFHLTFGFVLTRDDGLWKPSGAPLAEAVRRLGVAPERCLHVGDARHDLDAAREAGTGAVVILHDEGGELAAEADLSFADVPALVRCLRVLLP